MSTFHIKTWGCQMNQADTEKISHMLGELGYTEVTKDEDADVIILNTCSVRQRAEDKVLGQSRNIVKMKEKKPELRVVLTGCMAQRLIRTECAEEDVRYAEGPERRMPWVDYIMSIGDLEGLERFLTGSSSSKRYLDCEQKHTSGCTAYIPISKGCDNFCTYCVVPFTRGEEASRGYPVIRNDVEEVVSKGYKLITLLGQNVNSWKGGYRGEEMSFAELLSNLSDISGDFWLTFLTSHPKDFGEGLIKVMSESEKVWPYLNLPVQSGSDDVLKRMNRGYTRKDYMEKISNLKGKLPNVRLSTDIIVGFPGEMEKDFKETISLLRDVEFGMVYVAEYSPRMPAASSTFEDDVPKAEKARRRRMVEELQSEIIKKQNRKDIGTSVKVLVLGEREGKMKDLRDVQFKNSAKEKIGRFAIVEVTESTSAGLRGRVSW